MPNHRIASKKRSTRLIRQQTDRNVNEIADVLLFT